MGLLHPRRCVRAKSLLAVLLIAHIHYWTGCGQSLVPAGGIGADGRLRIALDAAHPISNALANTAFRGPTMLEIDPVARSFRLVYSDSGKRLDGFYTIVGDRVEISRLEFANDGRLGVMTFNPGTKQVVNIDTSAGWTWQPSELRTSRPAGVDDYSVEAYSAANPELLAAATAKTKHGADFVAPALGFIGVIWLAVAIDVVVSTIFFVVVLVLLTLQSNTDADNDGVLDAVEDAGPGGGDANGDGVPDRLQNNVASVRNINGDFLTVVAPPGTSLSDVRSPGNPSPNTAPAGVFFPAGFIEFQLGNVSVGGSAQVQVIVNSAQPINIDSFWKFGREASNPVPHWFLFMFNGSTGATIAGNVITLNLVDGGRGDDDLFPNGVIIEPGAPGSSTDPGPQPPGPGPGPPDGGPQAPIVQDDLATTNEDASININVLANDSDPDGTLNADSLSISSGPANGTAMVDAAAGRIVYTPNANFNGTDTFTYQVCDNDNPPQCGTATVTVTVNPVNDPPTDGDEAAMSGQDDVTVLDLLTNASDVDGDTLSVIEAKDDLALTVNDAAGDVGWPPAALAGLALARVDNLPAGDGVYTITTANGAATITVASDGAATLDPAGALRGLLDGDTLVVTFGYTVGDGAGGMDMSTATFMVNGVTDGIVAVDDALAATEDLIDAPGESITFNVIDGTASGGMADEDLDGAGPPMVNGVVPGDMEGLTFTITGGSDLGEVTVMPVDPPDAGAVFQVDITTATGTARLTILADGMLTLEVVSGNPFGPIADGDSLEIALMYEAIDAQGETDTATVTIDIAGLASPPLAVDDEGELVEDTPGALVMGNVLDNDISFEGGPLTVTAVNGDPANVGPPQAGMFGFLQVFADGTFVYSLDNMSDAVQALEHDEVAMDAFEYTISDGMLTANGMIIITVIGVDDGPMVIETVPADLAVGVAADTNVVITFNEPTDVTGTWFEIDCSQSGVRTPANSVVTDDDPVFTIDPDVDFASGESCDCTIFASQVTDEDGIDPANMAANFEFSFTIAAAPVTMDDTDPTVLDGTSAPGDNIFHIGLNETTNGIIDVLDNDDRGMPPAGMRVFGNIRLNGTLCDGCTDDVNENTFDETVAPLDAIDGGSLTVLNGGDVIFTPPTDFVGLVTFDYQLTNVGGSSMSTVTMAVGNRAVCAPDGFAAATDETVMRDAADGLLADNGSGPDTGDFIVISAVQSAAGNVGVATTTDQGNTVTANADGSFTYVPMSGFGGTDTFTYTVSNGFGGSQCVVTIAVGGSPQCADDQFTTPFNTMLVRDVANGLFADNGNGPDTGGAFMVIRVQGDEANLGVITATNNAGAIIVQSDGSFTYSPPAGFSGDDGFIYTIGNALGESTCTVTITVEPEP